MLMYRYLGDNPEWEFILSEEMHMLPFRQHRDRLCKQRVRAVCIYHDL